MNSFPDQLEEERILREIDFLPSTICKVKYAIKQLAQDDKFGIGGFWYNGYGKAVLDRLIKELES